MKKIIRKGKWIKIILGLNKFTLYIPDIISINGDPIDISLSEKLGFMDIDPSRILLIEIKLKTGKVFFNISWKDTLELLSLIFKDSVVNGQKFNDIYQTYKYTKCRRHN